IADPIATDDGADRVQHTGLYTIYDHSTHERAAHVGGKRRHAVRHPVPAHSTWARSIRTVPVRHDVGPRGGVQPGNHDRAGPGRLPGGGGERDLLPAVADAGVVLAWGS